VPEISKPRHTSRRVALIVRGGWEGHHPVKTTDRLLPFFEENNFDVRVDDSPSVYANHDYMAAVDRIVQAVTMSTIEQAGVAGLRAAVEDGCGFAGWHGGLVDSYRSDTEYLQLVGGQFVAHPGKPQSERTGRPGDPWHRPLQVPVVWSRQWGLGRVFVSTPGHRLEDLDNTSLRVIIERGLLWAAR
jgi:type 1 glutamine amidotransferase